MKKFLAISLYVSLVGSCTKNLGNYRDKINNLSLIEINNVKVWKESNPEDLTGINIDDILLKGYSKEEFFRTVKGNGSSFIEYLIDRLDISSLQRMKDFDIFNSLFPESKEEAIDLIIKFFPSIPLEKVRIKVKKVIKSKSLDDSLAEVIEIEEEIASNVSPANIENHSDYESILIANPLNYAKDMHIKNENLIKNIINKFTSRFTEVINKNKKKIKNSSNLIKNLKNMISNYNEEIIDNLYTDLSKIIDKKHLYKLEDIKMLIKDNNKLSEIIKLLSNIDNLTKVDNRVFIRENFIWRVLREEEYNEESEKNAVKIKQERKHEKDVTEK